MLVDGLKHNLLSISQLCDEGNIVTFEHDKCIIKSPESKATRFVAQRRKNMYVLQLKDLADQDVCLVASKSDLLQLWHRRLGHASTSVIEKLQRLNIVEGLPKLNTHTDAICEACAKGKQIKSSFNSKTEVSTSRPLELLHMDLFGPISAASLSGKYYGYVIVDDYFRYT